MKKIILIVIITLFTFTIPVFANDSLTVLTEEWLPYNYMEDEQIIGISTDLVVKALKMANFNYKISLKPWKRVYNETLKNKNTLLFTTSRTKQRENLFKWVGPLYPRRIVLYRLKSNKNIIVNNINDLKKYTIGVVRGASVEEYLISKGFKDQIHYDKATIGKQSILKLFLNRVDLIPGSEISMPFRMQKTPYKFSELEMAFVLINQGGYYIAVNKNTSDKIVKKIQIALDSLIKEGMREKIIKKYLVD